MLEKVIRTMRENILKPKEEVDITDIFGAIISNILDNKDIILDCYKKETGLNFDFSMITEVFTKSNFNNYGNIDGVFKNQYGKVSSNFVPYGIVGAQIEKNILFKNYLQLIKLCIETRNSLILRSFNKNITLGIIVTIINDVLSQTVDFNNIVLTNSDLLNENLDLLIFDGKQEKFKNINEPYDKIYLGLGEYDLFVDEEVDNDLIKFCKKNNVNIIYDKKNAVEIINQGARYASSIMSSNPNKIREFVSNVKSSFVLVNTSPLVVEDINLFPEQLLRRKNVLIYK